MADVQQLVVAQAVVRQDLGAQAAAATADRVRSFNGWYDTAAITALCDRIVREVEARQRQTASATDAYLSRVLTILRGRPTPPAGSVKVTGLRVGVTHAGAYGRLADQFRYEISQGTPAPAALEHVVTRAETMAATDTDLAFRAQAQKVMIVRKVDGWRRIIHPEMSRGGTCGLCVAASDRTYKRGDLMALHDRCHCTVLPIVNGQDPGLDLNGQDLRVLYAKAGSTGAADLKKARYVIHMHGELGPVLRAAGDAWRSPSRVAADTSHAA
jgi:hypothetical protein